MNLKEHLELIKRNAIELINEEELMIKLSRGKPLRIKLGVDPTSSDLHLGHTVSLHKLRQFQELGHQIVFIIGDFTARIGDPSGRSETRPTLSEKEILAHAQTYQAQVFKILDKSKTEVVYNSEWLNKLGIEGLFGLASRYTIARLLERDDFQKRYQSGTPITVLEFLYPLLQGYDSVAVKSDIEIGGTDQKFNLLVGRDFQRDFKQEPQVVLTLPLLEGTDGVRKMSKSYGNYIGINEPAKEIFGKIMSVSDDLMWKYYQILTEHAVEEVKKISPRDAKVKLGYEIAAKYAGEQSAKDARDEFNRIFVQKEQPDNIEEYKVNAGEIDIIELLTISGMAESKRAAQRLIEQGGVKIDNVKIENKSVKIKIDKPVVVQVGKRQFKKIVPK